MNNNTSCTGCNRSFTQIDSIFIYSICKHSYCNTCYSNHEHPSTTICPSCNNTQPLPIKAFSSTTCPYHNQLNTYYCKDHLHLLCEQCKTEPTHNKHSFLSINEAIQQLSSQLKLNVNIDTVNHKEQMILNFINEIETRMRIVNDTFKESNSNNKLFYKELIEMLSKRENEIQQKFTALKNNVYTVLESELAKMNTQKNEIQYLKDNINEVTTHNKSNNTIEWLNEMIKMKMYYDCILQLNEKELHKQLHMIELNDINKFDIDKDKELTDIINVLNEIKEKNIKDRKTGIINIKKKRITKGKTFVDQVNKVEKGINVNMGVMNNDEMKFTYVNDNITNRNALVQHRELFPVFYTSKDTAQLHSIKCSTLESLEALCLNTKDSFTCSSPNNNKHSKQKPKRKAKPTQHKPLTPVNTHNNNTTLSLSINDTTIDNNINLHSFLKPLSLSIFIFGGKPSSTTLSYSFLHSKWKHLKQCNINRSEFLSVRYREHNTLILGGILSKSNHSISDSVYLLNTKNQTLSKLSMKLSHPRCRFGGGFIMDKLFICGGYDGNNVLNTCEYFDIVNKKWIALSPMNVKRMNFAYVNTPDNCLYVIGGEDESGNVVPYVEKYDVIKQTWSSVSNLNHKRKGASAIIMPDGIYVIGGYDGVHYLRSVERFDYVDKKWKYVAEMKAERCFFAVAPSEDSKCIYVFGGYNGSPLKGVERYEGGDVNKWEVVLELEKEKYKHHCVYEINI